MRPEDFTIEFSHWDGDDERGCEWNLTLACPANDGWEAPIDSHPSQTLGEAMDAARRHIADKHADEQSPAAYPDTPDANART